MGVERDARDARIARLAQDRLESKDDGDSAVQENSALNQRQDCSGIFFEGGSCDKRDRRYERERERERERESMRERGRGRYRREGLVGVEL